MQTYKEHQAEKEAAAKAADESASAQLEVKKIVLAPLIDQAKKAMCYDEKAAAPILAAMADGKAMTHDVYCDHCDTLPLVSVAGTWGWGPPLCPACGTTCPL